MNMILKYNDTATFVEVASDGYRGSKVMVQQFDVNVIFLQNTGFNQNAFQENVDADAFCYPDITDANIIAMHNRLEGLYVLAPLFGADEAQGWYKITSVTINRDHLLNNEIDNIECALKKAEPIAGAS